MGISLLWQMKTDTDMDVFADEHMVEMNRRQGRGGGRRHARLRLSRSPTPSLPPTPPLTPTTPSVPTPLSSSGTTAVSSCDDRENQATPPLHAVNGLEAAINKHTDSGLKDQPVRHSTVKAGLVEVAKTQPAPFTSSALPDDKTNAVSSSSAAPPTPSGMGGSGTSGNGSGGVSSARSPLDKVQQLSRKRERTPSPTLVVGLPNSKRLAIATNSTSLAGAASSGGLPIEATSKTAPSSGIKNNVKTPSPLPNARGSVSSASKVLTEEIQKQQGQENARLKLMIFKEIRKPGKSE